MTLSWILPPSAQLLGVGLTTQEVSLSLAFGASGGVEGESATAEASGRHPTCWQQRSASDNHVARWLRQTVAVAKKSTGSFRES